MTDQHGQSLMDKVKDALGMGDDDHDTDEPMRRTGDTGMNPDADSTIRDIGAGAGAGTANRPAGPDYAGADETPMAGADGGTTSEWDRGEGASVQTRFGTADEEEDLGLEGTNRPD